MGLCLISDVNYYWLDWLIGLLFISKVSFRIAICKLAWCAAVYHLWQQRNAVIHSGKIRTEEQIIKDVKRDVKRKIECRSIVAASVLNGIMCYKWRISPAILCSMPTK